jgi:hypothetical protein
MTAPRPAAPLSRRRDPSAAEELADRLDKPMGALGLVFVLVVLGQLLATDNRLVLALSVAGGCSGRCSSPSSACAPTSPATNVDSGPETGGRCCFCCCRSCGSRARSPSQGG